MNNRSFDEAKSRDKFLDILIILVACVVECNIFNIIFINTESSADSISEVSADVFDSDVRHTEIGFGMEIKTFRMIFVDIILDFAKKGPIAAVIFSRRTSEKELRRKV